MATAIHLWMPPQPAVPTPTPRDPLGPSRDRLLPDAAYERLARATKFCEDVAAGRVERGIDANEVALASSRPFGPDELGPKRVARAWGEDGKDGDP
jgi:hypothetical protein